MTKKLITMLLCVILMMGALCGGAMAADDEFSVVSAYRTENTFYSFLSFDKNTPEMFKGSTKNIGGGVSPEPLLGDSIGSTYVVLLDTSISMQNSTKSVNEMLKSLLANKLWRSRVVIIPYTENPQLDKITDTFGMTLQEAEGALDKVFEDIEFTNADNLSCKSVVKVLDYLSENFPAQKGDIVNIILVTDNFEDATSLAEKELITSLEETPEVILHTVLVDKQRNGGARFGSEGLNLVINKKIKGADAAADLVEYIGGLYRMAIPMKADASKERSNVEWYVQIFKTGEELSAKSEYVNTASAALMLNNPDKTGMYIIGLESVKEDQGLEVIDTATADEESIIPQKSEEQSTNTEEKTPGESASTEEIAEDIVEVSGETTDTETSEETEEISDVENAEDSEETVSAEETEEKDNKSLVIILGIAVALLFIALVAILLIAKFKKTPANEGIALKFEVISGKCVSKKTEFMLSNELLIGSGKKCDIVFDEPEVSYTNTRLFINNGFIYIEDLNSERGTAIEGMRIFCPNRLRSGNEVSIASVKFCFKF